MKFKLLCLLIMSVLLIRCFGQSNTPEEFPDASSEAPVPESLEIPEWTPETETEASEEPSLPEETEGTFPPPETGDFVIPDITLPVQELFDDLSVEDASRFFFRYGLLSPEEKQVYNTLASGIYERKASVYLAPYKISVLTAGNAVRALAADQPNLFYFTGEFHYRTNEAGEILDILPDYLSFPDFEKARLDFYNEVQDYLRETRSMSPEEAEHYVLCRISRQVSYESTAYDQSAYGALTEKKCVCAGYARAFQLILMLNKIPCYYCNGDMIPANGEAVRHAWNIISLDGAFYNVDVTVCDQDSRNYVSYSDYNVSDSSMVPTHRRNDFSLQLPACPADGPFEEIFGFSRGVLSAMDYGNCRELVRTLDEFGELYRAFTDGDTPADSLSFVLESSDLLREISSVLRHSPVAMETRGFPDGAILTVITLRQ